MVGKRLLGRHGSGLLGVGVHNTFLEALFFLLPSPRRFSGEGGAGGAVNVGYVSGGDRSAARNLPPCRE